MLEVVLKVSRRFKHAGLPQSPIRQVEASYAEEDSQQNQDDGEDDHNSSLVSIAPCRSTESADGWRFRTSMGVIFELPLRGQNRFLMSGSLLIETWRMECMGMDWHDAALGMAGVIGSGVAIVHGVLTQRLMVVPFEQLAVGRISAPIRRLVPLLLQFSTFNWFVGGIALIVAATRLEHEARLATGLLVGSSYLFGALGNLWGIRRLHTGWVLYGVALLLIGYGLRGPHG